MSELATQGKALLGGVVSWVNSHKIYGIFITFLVLGCFAGVSYSHNEVRKTEERVHSVEDSLMVIQRTLDIVNSKLDVVIELNKTR